MKTSDDYIIFESSEFSLEEKMYFEFSTESDWDGILYYEYYDDIANISNISNIINITFLGSKPKFHKKFSSQSSKTVNKTRVSVSKEFQIIKKQEI